MSAPASSESRHAAAAEDERTFCTSCGQRLAPNHRFCGWCGHPVS